MWRRHRGVTATISWRIQITWTATTNSQVQSAEWNSIICLSNRAITWDQYSFGTSDGAPLQARHFKLCWFGPIENSSLVVLESLRESFSASYVRCRTGKWAIWERQKEPPWWKGPTAVCFSYQKSAKKRTQTRIYYTRKMLRWKRCFCRASGCSTQRTWCRPALHVIIESIIRQTPFRQLNTPENWTNNLLDIGNGGH